MCKSSVYFSIHQTFAPKTPLSCQREFQGDTEIAGGGGIGTAGEQRGVRLLIIVGGDGHQATQGVIGHKRDLTALLPLEAEEVPEAMSRVMAA